MNADYIEIAANQMIDLAAKVTDDQLTRATPCDGTDLSGLLAHVIGLSAAFAAAGHKEFGPLTSTPPNPGAETLPDFWWASLTGNLRDLVLSWQRPDAWEGMTQAGGFEAPAEVLGTVALSELVLHGWDVARSIGVDYTIPDPVASAVFDLHHPPEPQSERDGMFGPIVEVPEDAPILDRLVGLAGRQPFWPHGTLEE
ncbi:TIGR03086 family metal-binding protein [Gordonia sp. ABSL49_1]|uniref:TIGR03086 family metal-binding protein n=1 Tax=Gordonia sp. ABSL49_1 TaxID=2920941 RepID=UPI001F0D48DB|nr:TIGR03086 family metal-binding protein [Gordonia sp. ABSL49_1]MCH5645219.1 TIGR03086 family metal-binding protein [Gordonia sp. ABSL49_1]